MCALTFRLHGTLATVQVIHFIKVGNITQHDIHVTHVMYCPINTNVYHIKLYNMLTGVILDLVLCYHHAGSSTGSWK